MYGKFLFQYEVKNNIQTLHCPLALGWGCIKFRRWNNTLDNEKIKKVYDDVEPAVPTSQVDKLMPTDCVTKKIIIPTMI